MKILRGQPDASVPPKLTGANSLTTFSPNEPMSYTKDWLQVPLGGR